MSGARRRSGRPFRLLPWFSAVSAVTIALLALGLAIFLSRFLSDMVLQHDAELMTQFINNVVETEQAQAFFASSGRAPAEGDIEEFLSHLAGMPGVIRANAYDRHDRVIWSSQPDLIGRAFPDNDELKQAYLGRAAINVSGVAGDEKPEHIFFSNSHLRFIENYLPIWSHGPGQATVVGAVEVYRQPLHLFEALAASTQKLWLSAAGVALGLYGVLFWMVRRASRMITSQQAQLLENETLATMGEMASTVAHGLRNPLASIRSSAELALESKPSPEVGALLMEVMTQSDRLEGWVRQYLSYARSEQSTSDHADVSAALTNCLEALSSQLARRNIKPRLELEGDLPLCTLNPVILDQSFNSLVTNAIEAMSNGGELIIRATHCTTRRMLHITIEDTGPGMSPTALQEAFLPFKTTKGTGLGLGLPLTRQILRRYGGELTVSSEQHRGTRAIVELPIAD